MTKCTVTELPRRLEPVSRDPFIDSPPKERGDEAPTSERRHVLGRPVASAGGPEACQPPTATRQSSVLVRFGRDAARVPLVALQGTMEAVVATDFLDRVVDVPTLVVGGLYDQIFGPDALQDGVVAPLPVARLELLDCGHEIPLERPRELAELIGGFVSELADAVPQEGRLATDGISGSALRPTR